MTRDTLYIGVLASHHGSTLQALIDAIDAGSLRAKIALMIANNSTAKAFVRSKAATIPTLHLSTYTQGSEEALDQAIVQALFAHHVEVVACCGYMKKVGPRVLKHYAGRVLNVHPSLLPAYGGQGMYGLRVHQAVLEAKETITGATLHVVDSTYDQGPILAQQRIPILKGMDAESLQRAVQKVERELYVSTLTRLANGEL